MDLDLSGTWRAAATDSAAEPTATGDGYDDSGWSTVTVPGHWQDTASFADHEGPVMYRTRFTAPPPDEGRRTWLRFEGIFYQADVWMDHAYLGDIEGYFAPHSFEVTDLVRSGGDHTLAVEVTCRRSSDPRRASTLLGAYDDAPPTAPLANPGGIWGPVGLVETGPVAIRHFRAVCIAASEAEASVRLRAVVDSAGENPVDVRRWVDRESATDTITLSPGENHLEWTVDVARPQLWWPHSLGDPHLVETGVEITGAEGRPSDRRSVFTGLRSIELRGWLTSINGRRLFLKGANQRPLDQWPARLDTTRIDRMIDDALAVGLDLVRLQGHVAPPQLYTAADRAGLLIWADLPLLGGVSRSVRREAARQAREAVDLLGHHPSVVLWGAHNASGTPRRRGAETTRPSRARRLVSAAAAQQLPSFAAVVVDGAVARSLRRADPSRPVIAHSGRVPSLPLLDGTDTQMGVGWYVGGLRSLERWAAALPRLVRFVSDFGAQALDPSAIDTTAPSWPEPDWEALASRHGIEAPQLNDRVPPHGHASPSAWAHATVTYQAIVLTHHIETLRRLKYRPAGGFCFTSLDAPESGDPWAIVGPTGERGAAFDAVTAACAPVIVVADRLPDSMRPSAGAAVDIHVVNDRHEPVGNAIVRAVLRSPSRSTSDDGQGTSTRTPPRW